MDDARTARAPVLMVTRRVVRLGRKRAVIGLVAGVLATVLGAGLAAGRAAPAGAGAVAARARPAPRRPAVLSPLVTPAPLRPLDHLAAPWEGRWKPTGREVAGHAAVYTTTLGLPDNPGALAGVAWMDTRLLSARLYSGSSSPGGLFWKYTAPVSPAAAKTLVAAFAGGFLLKDAQGGYLSEGHLVAPLRTGAASLVIFANGTATVGAWGREVSMSRSVVAVRQNLTLLVDHGQPVAGLNAADTSVWGSSLHGIADTPRSGLGVTANGALVYVSGPMNIVDLATILVRAGAVRAMVLDMNPFWTVFATYSPATPGGAATPANGTDLLASMYQGPGRFFETAYARDFVTMSAR